MGKLRDRMEQDLILKGLAATTRRNYLLYCHKFAAHFGRSPEELGEAEIRAFLMHLIQVEQVSYATYRQILAALKFLYRATLGREWEVNRVPFPRHRQARLPCVLRDDQLRALFAALKSPKYRALFMTCYAAGLRIGEACRLQVGDIDSRRMVIRESRGFRSTGSYWHARSAGATATVSRHVLRRRIGTPVTASPLTTGSRTSVP